MSYLVDTHVFIWSLLSPQKISRRVKGILLDAEYSKYVSTITFLEISLKFQLGKIDLKGVYPHELPAIAKESGFEFLNLSIEEVASFYKLPKFKNKDPFDRMLAWQAINKNYCLLTKDPDFISYKEYGLQIIW